MSTVPTEYMDRWNKVNEAKSAMEIAMLELLRDKGVTPETLADLRKQYAEISELYVSTKEWLMQKYPNEGELHMPWNVRG